MQLRVSGASSFGVCLSLILSVVLVGPNDSIECSLPRQRRTHGNLLTVSRLQRNQVVDCPVWDNTDRIQALIRRKFKRTMQRFAKPTNSHYYYFEIILDVVTCEMKLFWNNFEIISVFYFTRNHWRWSHVKQELIRRWDTRTWLDVSLICLLIYHWT